MSLLDDLVSYWKLDEASGDAIDAHGANDLTDTNTVGTATGILNDGRDFERDNSEQFTDADNADLSTGDIDFSVSLWIKFESLAAFDTQILAGKAEFIDAADGYEWVVMFSGSSERLALAVSNGTTSTSVTANTFGALSAGVWHHVVAWHDAASNEIGLSVNRTEDTAAHSAGAHDSTRLFRLGTDGSGGRYADGVMDEVGFWKRVLTTDEKDDLYNSGNGLSYDDFGGGGAEPLNRLLLLGVG